MLPSHIVIHIFWILHYCLVYGEYYTKNKKPLALSEKAGKDKRFKFFHDLPEDTFEAFLSVPIMNKSGVIGVINVQHKNKHTYNGSEVDVLAVIGRLVGSFVENAQLIKESLTLKEILQTRKIVEKAKGILMKRFDIGEEKAYRRIQKQSMNMRKSTRKIAEAILVSEKLAINGS